MAKNIKIVQCPKCGSTNKKEIKQDYFSCNSCGAEYFLDNDTVTVNHNYNNGSSANKNFFADNKTRMIVIISFATLLFIFFISKIWSGNNVVKQSSGVTIESLSPDKIRWSSPEIESFVNKAGKPMILIIGEKDEDKRGEKNSFYADVVDASDSKTIKSNKVDGIIPASSNDIVIRTFEGGEIYAIVNKKYVLHFDKSNYGVTDVTISLFKNANELNVGLAKIEFTIAKEGDGFQLLTNDGEKLNYYPAIEKVLPANKVWEAQNGFDNLGSNVREKIGFAFTSYMPDVDTKGYQLIKYSYKDNVGGPKKGATFGWTKEHYMDRSSPSGMSYKLVLLSEFSRKLGRVVKFEDFTPNRKYLKPTVLFSDDELLLIFYGATAAEDAPTILQSMDAKSGKILFSTTLENKAYLKRAIHYKEGIVAEGNSKTYTIGLDGKLLNTFSVY